MSLIGSVSLTEPKDGIYLGRVNVDNYNLEPNQIAYSADGINLEGLNLGAGLDILGSDLQTIGNPEIQLVSNSIYVNDNVGATPIQTAIDNATQSDVLYISSGSYGEPQVSINSKYNIALSGPPTGQYSSTVCEVLNGFTLKGTTEQVRFSNLQIKGSNSLSGIGRFKFQGCVFSGTSGSPCSITVNNLTQFINYLTNKIFTNTSKYYLFVHNFFLNFTTYIITTNSSNF